MSAKDVCYYLRFKKSSLYHYVKKGWLPKPIKKNGSPFWNLDEVREWLKRDPPAGGTSKLPNAGKNDR